MICRSVALAAALIASKASAAPPRLIVLISIDTLRGDRAPGPLTPRLARFAQGATVFKNATVQATWTLPSHASMLTSLYPSSHGAGGTAGESIADWRGISTAAVSVAALLGERGYRTEALVSSPVLDAKWGFARGFDDYRRGGYGPASDERTLEEAARRVETLGDERLFLFVHSNIVHAYVRIKSAPSESRSPACPITADDLLPAPAQRPMPDDARSPRCGDDRRAYDRAVGCMDQALSRLLDALKKKAASRDALVIFTSDHGETLCEDHPGTPLRGHGFAGYSEQVEVPLVVWLAGSRTAGARIVQPVREIDLAATILDAAGAPQPPYFQGRSLLPLLKGRALPDRPSLAEGDRWKAARAGRYEYLRRAEGAEELYDLSRGRPERENVVSGDRDAVTALRRALEELPSSAATAAPTAVDRTLREALKAEGYLR